jgi:hypothetical protein
MGTAADIFVYIICYIVVYGTIGVFLFIVLLWMICGPVHIVFWLLRLWLRVRAWVLNVPYKDPTLPYC